MKLLVLSDSQLAMTEGTPLSKAMLYVCERGLHVPPTPLWHAVTMHDAQHPASAQETLNQFFMPTTSHIELANSPPKLT
jgi:hypothetical protein